MSYSEDQLPVERGQIWVRREELDDANPTEWVVAGPLINQPGWALTADGGATFLHLSTGDIVIDFVLR